MGVSNLGSQFQSSLLPPCRRRESLLLSMLIHSCRIDFRIALRLEVIKENVEFVQGRCSGPPLDVLDCKNSVDQCARKKINIDLGDSKRAYGAKGHY